MISDTSKWQDFKKQEFKLKEFEEDDVDIAIDGMFLGDILF